MSTIEKTDAEWRATLSPEQYAVLREHGTERAFTGLTHDEKRPGEYRCAGCGTLLFSAASKFDSGTGWPSFTRPVSPGAVTEHTDTKFGMRRTEVRCATCGGHLGHVFPDGPHAEGGMRYCMNSAALDFAPQCSGAAPGQPVHVG